MDANSVHEVLKVEQFESLHLCCRVQMVYLRRDLRGKMALRKMHPVPENLDNRPVTKSPEGGNRADNLLW